ncbi:hypothetical protein F3F78_22370 [Bacteroides salyersiae]|nr:hypothetical protein F3F78_22370 [Bacteroides salyersiae]KAB5356809.1 hypothetical protein F9998_19940 [Bacteroides salyersiae]RYT48661.1 hypothetical protein EAJ08_10730 [Bacteroides salyersiae]
MSVSLQCVFHSIRFKVNKGWSKALLLFLCPYPKLSFFRMAKIYGYLHYFYCPMIPLYPCSMIRNPYNFSGSLLFKRFNLL